MFYRNLSKSVPDGVTADVHEERRRAMVWLNDYALPFWTTTGYDARSCLFHERVTLNGQPLFQLPHRLMVQCRQMYVLAHASLIGMYDGCALLQRTFDRVHDWYRHLSLSGRWAFSVYGDGKVADRRCDSYSLAFLLMALAWLYRVRPDKQLLGLVDEVYDVLDGPLAATGGGVLDGLPRPDQFRRQNPNMHLMEAHLSLYEAAFRKKDLDRATTIWNLFSSKLFDWTCMALPELHRDDWCTATPDDAWFEPGHHFEWVWLLRRLAGVAPISVDSCAEALLSRAMAEGIDAEGFAIDRVDILSGRQAATRRCWSTCEFVKACAAETESGCCSDWQTKAASGLKALRIGFLANVKPGLWIDRIDGHGNPISTDVPASTLYHLFLTVCEATRVFGSVRPQYGRHLLSRRPALFLDRDGVLNHDIGYPTRPADIRWVEGASLAIRIANDAGYAVVVVSNQSCVGRGLATEREVCALHEWMAARLADEGAYVEGWYYCPYHPTASNAAYLHPCHYERKPNPGLILRAAVELSLDLQASLLIGDKGTDIEAAHRAGVRGSLFSGGNLADFVTGILNG
jgi:D,D-heptose 1,7-bisphosphate phosphatase